MSMSSCFIVSLQTADGVVQFNNYSLPTNGPRPDLRAYKKSKNLTYLAYYHKQAK